jgi:hypothetical protein
VQVLEGMGCQAWPRYRYIALLDIDEVILPLQHNSWADMMAEVEKASLAEKNESRANWNFRTVYFFDNASQPDDLNASHSIPPYMHMLRHVRRSAKHTKPGEYIKCFHNPDLPLTLHNHFPFSCLGGKCLTYNVNTSIAHIQHSRADCVNELKKSCEREFKNVSVKDTAIWRWQDDVVQRTSSTLSQLGFLLQSTDT